jgi:hypothetical protein
MSFNKRILAKCKSHTCNKLVLLERRMCVCVGFVMCGFCDFCVCEDFVMCGCLGVMYTVL